MVIGVRLAQMPALLPDELLHSLLARTLLVNAMERPQRSLSKLLGGHLPMASVDLTSRIAELHRRLGEWAPTKTAVELLEQATLFPYHRGFLSPDRGERVAASLLGGATSGLRSTMGLAANRFGCATILRYCPQCVREDHAQWTTPYWRRAHHLPGVTACFRHGLRLVRCIAPSTSGNKQALKLPPWIADGCDDDQVATQAQMRFANLSAQALHDPAAPVTPQRRSAVYQRSVLDLGFGGPRARIDHDRLAEALTAYHAGFDGFEHQARLLATDQTPLAWLRPLLARPQRAVHPICHLVLIDFLFGNWHGCTAALHARIPIVAVPVPRVDPGTFPTTSARGVDAVLDASLSCREAARRSGLCVTTVATRRRAAGLAVSSRRRIVCGPLLDRVLALILAGSSPALIAERTGVSMSTAYRLLREHGLDVTESRLAEKQELRQTQRERWLTLARQDLAIKVARRREPACYAWLYRNDRAWLADANATFAKAPRTTARVDWPARDEAWADRVHAYACAWRARHERARLSPSAVRRALGQWTVHAHRDRLPSVSQRLREATQTRAQFQHARMDDAIKSLARDGVAASPAAVLKRSGLRALPRPFCQNSLSTRRDDIDDAHSIPAKPAT